MFYNFLVPPASEWSALNVLLRYISFRSMGALITAPHYNHNRWSCIYFLAAQGKMRGQYILPDVKTCNKSRYSHNGGCLFSSAWEQAFFFGPDLTNYYVWQTLFVFGFWLNWIMGWYYKIKTSWKQGHITKSQNFWTNGYCLHCHVASMGKSGLYEPIIYPFFQGLDNKSRMAIFAIWNIFDGSGFQCGKPDRWAWWAFNRPFNYSGPCFCNFYLHHRK